MQGITGNSSKNLLTLIIIRPGGAGLNKQYSRWKTMRDEKKRTRLKNKNLEDEDTGVFAHYAHENFALRALHSISLGAKFRKCCQKMGSICRRDQMGDSKLKKLKASKASSSGLGNEAGGSIFEVLSSGESDDDVREKFR